MSLVCKAACISYGRVAMEYAKNRTLKEDYDPEKNAYAKDTGILIADEFDRKGLKGVTADECWHEMQQWKRRTGHDDSKLDCFWLTIAPSEDIIDKLDEGELETSAGTIGWKELYDDFLREMGMANAMRLGIMHDRTERNDKRKHIHIAVSRIDLNGNVIENHNIAAKAKKVAEKLSKKYGLETAEEIGKEKKDIIKNIARDVLSRLPEYSFEEYKEALAKRGINIETYADKKGNVKGYRMFLGEEGFKYKISDVDRSLTFGRIEATYKRLHEQYIRSNSPEEKLKQAGIRRAAIRKSQDGNYYIRVSTKDNPGSRNWSKEVKLTDNERIGYVKGKMSLKAIAANHFTKAISQSGSRGANREWEINLSNWDDFDDEMSQKRKNGISM